MIGAATVNPARRCFLGSRTRPAGRVYRGGPFRQSYKYDTSWDMSRQGPTSSRRTGARSVRYREIASDLRGQIESGHLAPGSVLPSEATLSAHFDTSRVTVRKALELLREDGLVSSRQGAGWFVAVDQVQQRLARLGTIEAQLAASERDGEREILGFAFTSAPAWVAAHLDTDEVLEVTRRNLADGTPFARVTVWCPQAVGHHLSRADVEAAPFYEVLGVQLGGAVQTIAAAAAGDADAEILGVPADAPVLRCTRVTSDAEGRAILVAEHVFPGHLTEFVVEIDAGALSEAPNGLRLVNAS